MTTRYHVFPNREVQVMCRNQVKVVQEGVLARQSVPSLGRHFFEWASMAGADVSRSHGGSHQVVLLVLAEQRFGFRSKDFRAVSGKVVPKLRQCLKTPQRGLPRGRHAELCQLRGAPGEAYS